MKENRQKLTKTIVDQAEYPYPGKNRQLWLAAVLILVLLVTLIGVPDPMGCWLPGLSVNAGATNLSGCDTERDVQRGLPG